MSNSITRRRWLITTAGLSMAATAKSRPNIVLIVADDLGYGELACQGNPEIPTPNIDSIAHNGVRFTNGYVTAPMCSPSRAALMTGRYQTRFGHEWTPIGAQNQDAGVGLPLTEITLADALKSAGYATCILGKWHLGGRPEFNPLRRGFDEFFGFANEGHYYVPPPYRGVVSHFRDQEYAYDDGNPLLRGATPVQEREYLTDAFAREAASFIERRRNQPFFLYLPFNAVHSPMQVPHKYVRRFRGMTTLHRWVFAGMLSAMDDAVGAVLTKLKQTGLEENTLIFFLSDNGGPTEELTSSNAPLRGGKGTLWEGGMRIPYLVQWKGRLPAGRREDRPVSSLDIFPTALAAAGVAPRTDRIIDGVNLLPYIERKNGSLPHQTLFWRHGGAAFRDGNWKLIAPQGLTHGTPDWQLYDLSEDIAETRNLAVQMPDVVRRLAAEFEALNAQMVKPLWLPNRGQAK
jgi:arylsulfatase B